MAATSRINSSSSSNNNKSMRRVEASREEIQAAIAKAAELRAIHASLMLPNSPSHSNPSFPSSSPQISRPIPPQLSAQDYPVFTPCYEDEALPMAGYTHIHPDSRVCTQGWANDSRSSRKDLTNIDSHSVTSPCINQTLRSRRRNSLGDADSITSSSTTCKQSNIVVPLTDSHMSLHSSRRHPKGSTVFSKLFPNLKKKNTSSKSEEASQILKDLGLFSVESLKKEVIDANRVRDSALAEAAEIRASFGDLQRKLQSLESHCGELKRGLKQAAQAKNVTAPENGLPVSNEAMVEGFIQIVSEARLSIKQFCRNLVSQVDQSDDQQINNLNSLLKPYKQSLTSNRSSFKSIVHHLESIVSRSLYQDFENSAFQKNGAPKLLDPHQDRQAQFSSFVALRNLSWSEVLRKGTKYHSEEFSRFCDEKMSCIVSTLNWIRPWPEQLLEGFFVAAKCVWLMHLLAFSFWPALGILRVEEDREFDPRYMEDLMADRRRGQQGQGLSQVRVMVTPGFYVQDRIVRCKVLCRSKSTT